jgi:hypothetical protein
VPGQLAGLADRLAGCDLGAGAAHVAGHLHGHGVGLAAERELVAVLARAVCG